MDKIFIKLISGWHWQTTPDLAVGLEVQLNDAMTRAVNDKFHRSVSLVIWQTVQNSAFCKVEFVTKPTTTDQHRFNRLYKEIP